MVFLDPEDYQPQVRQIFNELQSSLSKILPYARIEHIGASSIAGAISKGDLDIFVGIEEDKFNVSLDAIESLGFKVKKDTLRTESLCMLETTNYKIDVAIQLVENGTQWESFILFRDRLRRSPQLLNAYNQLKKNCQGLSSNEYRKIKSDFISKTLHGAET